MNIEKLFAVLEKQETNLKNLLKSVLGKQAALVNGNSDLIKESVSKEEKLLLNIQVAEETRLKVMQGLFSEYGIDNERYKLEILISNISGKVSESIVKSISLTERRIKSTIKEIQKINHQNMALIQQSRSLISETINAVINTQKRSIVDRKG